MIKTYETTECRGEPRRVKFLCPLCKRWHIHGWPADESGPTHRTASCHPDGYYLLAPAAPTTEGKL